MAYSQWWMEWLTGCRWARQPTPEPTESPSPLCLQKHKMKIFEMKRLHVSITIYNNITYYISIPPRSCSLMIAGSGLDAESRALLEINGCVHMHCNPVLSYLMFPLHCGSSLPAVEMRMNLLLSGYCWRELELNLLSLHAEPDLSQYTVEMQRSLWQRSAEIIR